MIELPVEELEVTVTNSEDENITDNSYEIDDNHIASVDYEIKESDIFDTGYIQVGEDDVVGVIPDYDSTVSKNEYQERDRVVTLFSENPIYSISNNFVLDATEFSLSERQYNEICELLANCSVSSDYVTKDDFDYYVSSSLALDMIIIGLCFGYFVKETIFRGL